MLNLILFGPPGSGKGTQAEKLQAKYNLLHLSTGEVMRAEIKSGSALGQAAAKQMEGGALVSDELVCGIIGNYIKQNTDARGVIYDGFPRTIPQACEFDKMLQANNQSVTLMIALDVPDAEVIQRIITRGKISGRADDQSEEIIQNRINVYKSQTAVVADHYALQGKFYSLNGTGTIEQTFELICQTIDAHT